MTYQDGVYRWFDGRRRGCERNFEVYHFVLEPIISSPWAIELANVILQVS
jgi:hypothetical protein